MPHPHLPPSSSLINTFLFLSLFFPTYLSSDVKGYTACEPFSCGNFSNITYPFWSDQQADYCGHPNFKLDCQQDNLTIDIMSQTFHVIDMDSTSQILKIARLDLWGGVPCPKQYVNVNLDSDFFKYTSNDDNYTLLYDCSPHSYTSPSVNLDPSAIAFDCPIDGDIRDAFLVLSTKVVNFNILGCNNSIIVPVLAVAIKDDSDVESVLDKGFEVAWSGVDEDHCDGCKNSGGRCGYNASINAFMCLCLNQPIGNDVVCSKNLARSPLIAPTPRPTPSRALLPPYAPNNQEQNPHAPSMFSSFS